MNKLLLSILMIAGINTQTTQAQAQNLDAIKSSELQLVRTSELTNLLKMRFGSFESGSVQYSRAAIRISILRQGEPCSKTMPCINLIPAPVEIVLKVKSIVRKECEDVYYAQTDDTTKSMYFEQIRLSDPNVGRCQYIQEQKGELVYLISGQVQGSSTDSTVARIQSNWAQFLMGSKSSSAEQ